MAQNKTVKIVSNATDGVVDTLVIDVTETSENFVTRAYKKFAAARMLNLMTARNNYYVQPE